MTLNDDVVSAIEKTLLSSPVSYPYLETITKRFLLPLACKVGNKRMFSAGKQFEVYLYALTQMKHFQEANNSIISIFLNSIWRRFVFTEMDFLLLTVQ